MIITVIIIIIIMYPSFAFGIHGWNENIALTTRSSNLWTIKTQMNYIGCFKNNAGFKYFSSGEVKV
jgi:hypothetical protein